MIQPLHEILGWIYEIADIQHFLTHKNHAFIMFNLISQTLKSVFLKVSNDTKQCSKCSTKSQEKWSKLPYTEKNWKKICQNVNSSERQDDQWFYVSS